MKILKTPFSLWTVLALPISLTPLVAATYQSAILSDRPLAYYRFSDDTSRSSINKNSGSLGTAADATHDLGRVLPFSGAIAGDGNRSAFFDFTSRTEIPFSSDLNPPNTEPFTIEVWLYPATDVTSTGQSPLANRYTQSSDRQGWVFFQRKPDASYVGGEPVGWNFRMYNGIGGSGKLDVTSLVPYQVGKWQHVVVVYDPVDVINASVTIYIDGVAANTHVWNGGGSGTEPGYAPCTGDHPPEEAVNGQPALAIGNYNNANNALNPYFGAADEFAFYRAKLTPEQILAHYENGTNANRSTPYHALVQSDNPVAYLRLDELTPGPDVAINMGDLRAGGLATHTAEARHPAPGALAGRTDDGSVAHHQRNGRSTTTMPWLAENNPNAGVPFTFETWLKPMWDRQGAPFNNRYVASGNRTGWVIFQRNPNLTYPPSEGRGWNFRMYSGVGGSGGAEDLVTETDYTVGKWQHLVVTWQPESDNGDPGGNGNNQWQGTLTAYVDGVPVRTNRPLYAANREVPEAGDAADLAIGSYNVASGINNSPFEGNIDEFAFYNNYILTPEQILAHYQAGTESNYGTNYETLVLTAGFTGPERVGLPKTYLRFADPAYYPAANSGTLGYAADGTLNVTTNNIVGPEPPAYPGFESANSAVPLDGLKSWVSLNNLSGLNISGQITLEAWIKPDATQGDAARIISHGPPTLSFFLTASPIPDGAVTNGSEVFLRIDGAGTTYTVGSSDGTVANSASFPVPGGDLGGGSWIHLVGTCDGSTWKLFRNGLQVASSPTFDGAFPVDNADWAIGGTGNGWENLFAGAIDEVAIYNVALSPGRIADHYSLGKYGPSPITISRSGGGVTVMWATGTLQHADLLDGPYTDVGGGAAPPSYSTAANLTKKFYRIKF